MKWQKIVIFIIRMLKEGFIVKHKMHSNSCFKSKILSSIHSEYYRIKCLHNVANCLNLLYALMQLHNFISKTIVLFNWKFCNAILYIWNKPILAIFQNCLSQFSILTKAIIMVFYFSNSGLRTIYIMGAILIILSSIEYVIM